jgi:hypothetical protein
MWEQGMIRRLGGADGTQSTGAGFFDVADDIGFEPTLLETPTKTPGPR